MKKQSLVKGAFILTVAALITKVLGFANSIILSRVLGPEGIGLQMVVMPLVGFMITLTTLGLPLAISKLVAEAEAQQNEAKEKKILIVSLSVTISLSVLLVVVSMLFGQVFASYFLTDQRSYYSLMAIIPIIPIVAISGVIKGYFRGKQNMNPLALSQIIEQIVRISLIFFLVQWLIPYGIEFAAAGAVISSVIGEVASLLFLILMFRGSTRNQLKLSHYHWKQASGGKSIFLELLHTGLPSTGHGFIFSISRAIQPMIITKSLAVAGVSSVVITKQYGMLTGFVMPLLFLPGFINHPLSTALVPAISEANARKNFKLIHHRIYQAVRLSWIVGVPSTLILYLFSHELMTVVYHSPEAGSLLKVISPFFLFHYLLHPYQSALVGLGHAKAMMINSMFSKGTTLLLIYPLSANLGLGIYGVLLAISVGVILETLLHLFSVYKLVGFYVNLLDMIKVAVAGIVMGLLGRLIFSHLDHNNSPLLSMTMISIFYAILIYLIMLVLLKVIGLNDIKRIPVVARILTFLLKR